jgi:hypothetical protein
MREGLLSTIENTSSLFFTAGNLPGFGPLLGRTYPLFQLE